MKQSVNITLGELMLRGTGTVDPSQFPDEEFDLYSVPAFDSGKPERLKGAQIGSTKQIVGPGDVLLSKIVPHIRRCWVVRPADGRRLIASSEWIVFRNAKTDPSYLSRILVGNRFHAEFMQTVSGVGGSLMRARPSQVADIEITLPQIEEQRRIAAQLEQVDRLRRTRRYTLELSDSFLPATFRKLFGDDTRLPMLEVEDLLASKPNAMRTGPFGSQLLHSEFTDHGVAVLGIDNAVNNAFEWSQRRYISPKKYEQLRRYTVYPDDVIITIMGTCGRCAIVPSNIPTAINTKHLCCITLDKTRCLPSYLHAAFLYHPEVQHQLGISQKGAIMDGLNMEIIKNLRIPLPTPDRQKHFATLVAQHERLRATQRESLRQAEHLFQTLLHRAFSPD